MSLFVIRSSMVRDGSIRFPADESRHLCRVLRKKKGDKIECLDESGKRYSCVIHTADPVEAVADIITMFKTEETPAATELILVFPMIKGGKTEWILQKGTELGVNRFIPFAFRRTVVKPEPASRHERYRRVIHEACKQSEQGIEPTLDEIRTDVEALSELLGEGGECLRIVCWELEKRVMLKELLRGEIRPPDWVVIAVGPEGGISPEEMQQFRKAGFLSAGLGHRILRSETACLAAVAAVRYEFN